MPNGLKELLAAIADDPTALGSLIRYGKTPAEKYAMQARQEIPGMPAPFLPSGEENPDATRYASQYLANTSGHLPAGIVEAGNELAFDDWFRNKRDSDRVKEAGRAGARAATNGEKGGEDIASLLEMLGRRI